nr:unnamed protein product [Digitaria exilis]
MGGESITYQINPRPGGSPAQSAGPREEEGGGGGQTSGRWGSGGGAGTDADEAARKTAAAAAPAAMHSANDAEETGYTGVNYAGVGNGRSGGAGNGYGYLGMVYANGATDGGCSSQSTLSLASSVIIVALGCLRLL